MSKRSSELLLNDILECAQYIIEFTRDMDYQQFTEDRKTQDAVIRNFEIIGEAANRLPPETKIELSEIEWQKIRGFRNRLVHDYFGIDYQIVWHTKNEILPITILAIKSKLNL
jgi:uncharacterized protein with HEPN domain